MPLYLLCDAGFQGAFDRIANQIICAAVFARAKQSLRLPDTRPREILKIVAIHCADFMANQIETAQRIIAPFGTKV